MTAIKDISERSFLLILLLTVTLVSSYLLYLGVLPDIIWGHDLTHHMDAAWRISQGQIPRIDYYHHAYEIYHATIALFILLFGPHVAAITFTHIFFLITLTMLTWFICASRFVPRWNFVTSILILVSLAGLSPLGAAYDNITHGEFHNRVGWAVLTLCIIAFFFDAKKKSTVTEWVDPIVSGLLLGFLLAMKPSYFLVALTALGVGYYYQTVSRRHALRILAGLGIVFLAYSFYLSWRWLPFLTTNKSLMASFQIQPAALMIKAMSALVFVAFFPLVRKLPERVQVYYLFVLAAGIGILFTNLPQGSDPIVYLVLPLLGLRYTKIKESWLAMGMVAITGSWVLPSLVSLPQAYLSKAKIMAMPSIKRAQFDISSPSYTGWYSFSGGGPCQANEWLERINEGLVLLRKNSVETDKISTLDYSNVFPFALLRPSAKGGSILFHYGLNVDEKVVPDPEKLLADTDVVMVPGDCPENEAAIILKDRYDGYLKEHFPITYQTENWTLRKRRPSNP